MRMQSSEARMRESSVMRPGASCGTFRSARIKTRRPCAWPRAHRSEKRRMSFMAGGFLGRAWAAHPDAISKSFVKAKVKAKAKRGRHKCTASEAGEVHG